MLEQSGAKIITLGKRILRTETVALNMLSIILYELEIKGWKIISICLAKYLILFQLDLWLEKGMY